MVDRESFLDWLDSYDGYIPSSDLHDEWPEYPYSNLVGITCSLEDGEPMIPKRDLRQGLHGYPID